MRMTIWRMNAWEKLNPSVHQKRIGGRIANEILMYFRSLRKQSQEVSLYDPIDNDSDGNAISLLDVISCEDAMLEQVDLSDRQHLLYRYLAQALDARERRILLLRYGLTGQPPSGRWHSIAASAGRMYPASKKRRCKN